MYLLLRRTVAGVVLVVGTAVVALPGIAQASAVIPPNVTNPLLPPGSGGAVVRTGSHYWSVMAVRSAPGQDFDLTVDTPTGTVGSFEGQNHTDFVAINSNYQPLGTFPVGVTHYSGPDSADTYDEEFVDTAKIFTPTMYGATTGSPGNSQDIVDADAAITRNHNVAAVFDVQLTAGQYYVIRSSARDGNVFLLSSDPANAGTWVQSRSSALHVQTTCTRMRAARTDWYGLVILFDDGAGGYHSWEGYDVEVATADQGQSCAQAGSF